MSGVACPLPGHCRYVEKDPIRGKDKLTMPEVVTNPQDMRSHSSSFGSSHYYFNIARFNQYPKFEPEDLRYAVMGWTKISIHYMGIVCDYEAPNGFKWDKLLECIYMTALVHFGYWNCSENPALYAQRSTDLANWFMEVSSRDLDSGVSLTFTGNDIYVMTGS